MVLIVVCSDGITFRHQRFDLMLVYETEIRNVEADKPFYHLHPEEYGKYQVVPRNIVIRPRRNSSSMSVFFAYLSA